MELSCTWKDILEIGRVIDEAVSRLRYALKHLQRDMIPSLQSAITTTKAPFQAHYYCLHCYALWFAYLGRLSARTSARRLKKHQNRHRALPSETQSSEGRDYA